MASRERWEFLTTWQESDVSSNYENIVSGEDREDFSVLLHMEVPLLGELLIEENLHYAGTALGLSEHFSIF